jgi:hypothetical protein
MIRYQVLREETGRHIVLPLLAGQIVTAGRTYATRRDAREVADALNGRRRDNPREPSPNRPQ